jgi:hypothetical protein
VEHSKSGKNIFPDPLISFSFCIASRKPHGSFELARELGLRKTKFNYEDSAVGAIMPCDSRDEWQSNERTKKKGAGFPAPRFSRSASIRT